MIRFVNNINEIPDYPSSRVVLIDDTLLSEQAVIDRIEKALDAPPMKKTIGTVSGMRLPICRGWIVLLSCLCINPFLN